MIKRNRLACIFVLFVCLVGACVGSADSRQDDIGVVKHELEIDFTPRSFSSSFTTFDQSPAGVAGDRNVVFIGLPLEGKVQVLERFSGRSIGELPLPSTGFVLPFIIHTIGHNRIAVLDAGGLPSPEPFIPANPTIYEYSYKYSRNAGFSAVLTRNISFENTLIGFPEDFVRLDDGRYLLSDAVLGSIWIAETDGTINPGIVPETFYPEDAIAELAYCENASEIEVGGIPFLFSGATLPGVSPLAVRDDILFFYSPCAEGLYSIPLSSLFDSRAPHERSADITMVSAKPSDIPVEQLLGLTFNPFSIHDRYLYAADSLQLRVIRIDVETGDRQVVADNSTLFNFPSSTAFLPPFLGLSTLVVVSNQQHRSTLTNEAIQEDVLEMPFIVTKIISSNWF